MSFFKHTDFSFVQNICRINKSRRVLSYRSNVTTTTTLFECYIERTGQHQIVSPFSHFDADMSFTRAFTRSSGKGENPLLGFYLFKNSVIYNMRVILNISLIELWKNLGSFQIVDSLVTKCFPPNWEGGFLSDFVLYVFDTSTVSKSRFFSCV